MGPFQPSRGCLHSKTTSLNVIPGQVDVKHICNKLLKSQHDQATPLASTRGVVLWGVRVGEAVGPFQPSRVVYTPKLQVSMSYLARWMSNTSANKLLKSQHDQATPLASTRGVVYGECGSVKLWAHSSPAGVVYTPKLQVSMSYLARWISNTSATSS